MSDTNGTAPVTPEIATDTSSSPEVSKPFNSLKPYDDEILETYKEDVPAAKESEVAPPPPEAPAVEKPEEAKATKNDKVEDGFEKIVIKREINGKPLEFTVADAIKAKMNHEEVTRNLDRRATFIKQKEVAWQADQDNFKAKVQSVIEATRRGDFTSSIRALAKLAKGKSDLDVTTFEQQYFDQLDKVREVYSKMSPEERKAYFAERALAEAKAENSKYVEKEEQLKAREQLQIKVNQLLKENSIPETEFWDNYKYLIEEQIGEGKRFNSKEEITAEDVVDYSNEVRHWTKVYEAAEKAGVKDEAILDEIKKIATLNPSYTSADLIKIMDQAGLIAKTADSSTVENLNRKAGKSRLTQQGGSTKKQNGKIEGYDEESLEFLYRKQPKVYQRPIR